MQRDYKFQIGQSVYTTDNKVRVNGEVTDTTSHSIFIKWSDQSNATQHYPYEYENIFLSKKKKHEQQDKGKK